MRPLPELLSELESIQTRSFSLPEKIKQLSGLGWEFAEAWPIRALEIYQQITALLNEAALPHPVLRKAQAEALAVISAYERVDGQYTQSITHALEALAIFSEIAALKDNVETLARVYYNLGIAYNRLGDYSSSQEAHLHQLEMAELTGKPIARAEALRNLGFLYYRLGDFHEALNYYKQCETLLGPDHLFMSGVYNNISAAYTSVGKYEEALPYALKSIDLFAAGGYVLGLSRIHANVSRIYVAMQQFDLADAHLDQAMAQSMQSENLYSRLLTHQFRGELRIAQNRDEDAIREIQTALQIAFDTGDRWQQSNCYRLLAQIYERAEDWPAALSYYHKYVDIKDAMFSEESLARIRNIQQMRRIRQAQAEAETQQRLRAQERQNAERLLKMKDDFLNAATHDLKNPLAIIGVAVYKLRRYISGDNRAAHESLNRIDNMLVHMRDLITDLLDIARLQTGYVLMCEPGDLVALAQKVIDDFYELAERKDIRIELQSDQPKIQTLFDAARLRQVLANLVSNAIKYTDEGGHISVDLKTTQHEHYIRISDNGRGIAEEDLPRLFEMFFRASDQQGETEGTGLGLAIAKSIVEQHGGLIFAESTVGQGSTFTVILPAA